MKPVKKQKSSIITITKTEAEFDDFNNQYVVRLHSEDDKFYIGKGRTLHHALQEAWNDVEKYL